MPEVFRMTVIVTDIQNFIQGRSPLVPPLGSISFKNCRLPGKSWIHHWSWYLLVQNKEKGLIAKSFLYARIFSNATHIEWQFEVDDKRHLLQNSFTCFYINWHKPELDLCRQPASVNFLTPLMLQIHLNDIFFGILWKIYLLK